MPDPFLKRAQLGYWLAWIPMAGLVVAVVRVAGELTWSQAAASALPLSLVFALVGRSTWYMCRSLSLRRTGLVRLIGIHGGAAILAGGLWAALAAAFGRVLPDGWAVGLGSQQASLAGLGALFFLLSVAYHYVVLSMEAARRAEQRAAAEQILAREAELKALRAQVNPHFLFNSLNAIAALAGSDGERARRMCLDLAGFLRTSLKLGDRPEVILADELAMAEEYLAVEKVRFGDRLEIRKQVDPACLDSAVPPLLLQPVVENAVKHGIGSLPEGSWIQLSVACESDRVCIAVTNPYDPQAPPAVGTGRGVRLLKDRLAGRYGLSASLRRTRDGKTWRVEIRLPRQALKERPE